MLLLLWTISSFLSAFNLQQLDINPEPIVHGFIGERLTVDFSANWTDTFELLTITNTSNDIDIGYIHSVNETEIDVQSPFRSRFNGEVSSNSNRMTGKLHLMNLIQRDHNLKLEFKLRADSKENITKHTTVNVIELDIQLDTKETDITVVVGKSLSIHCQAHCSLNCSPMWFMGSKTISTEGGHLLISNVSANDNGIYTCVAVNEVNSRTCTQNKTINVIVLADNTSEMKEDNIYKTITAVLAVAVVIIILALIIVIMKKKIISIRNARVNRRATEREKSNSICAPKKYDGSYRDNDLYIPLESTANIRSKEEKRDSENHYMEIDGVSNQKHEERSQSCRSIISQKGQMNYHQSNGTGVHSDESGAFYFVLEKECDTDEIYQNVAQV